MSSPHEHAIHPVTECPRCDYALAGLPEQGQCPECGFAYGPETFILQGIARGASTLSRGRLFLLMFIALTLWLWPQSFVIAGWNGLLGAVLLTGALVAAFVQTGRRQRRGFEPFIFCPSGFGPLAMLTINDPDLPFTWDGINTVEIRPVGKTWQRLRIGAIPADESRLRTPVFDAGVRVERDEIPKLEAMLQSFMDRAYVGAGAGVE